MSFQSSLSVIEMQLKKLVARYLLTALRKDDLDDALAMLSEDETLAE